MGLCVCFYRLFVSHVDITFDEMLICKLHCHLILKIINLLFLNFKVMSISVLN